MSSFDKPKSPHRDPPGVTMLQSATLYLMSRYAQNASRETALGVVQHLEMLRAHPQTRERNWSLNACEVLLRQWRTIAQAPVACADIGREVVH